jgi:hypothetical protein
MLNLRIARSPLPRAENEAVLTEYNRLTGARIPIDEFEHWVQKGPAGPAWHALLETDEGRIVGHTSVFPMRTSYRDAQLIPAKSEYSVLHEDFRRMKVRGFEKVAQPAFILILDQLFRHCLAQGWEPLFASTNEKNQVFTRKVGLRPLEFCVRECLLILRPWKSAVETPNIGNKERTALFVAGLGQRTVWSAALAVFRSANGISSVAIDSSPLGSTGDRLSFFNDVDSLSWRYLGQQYIRFENHNSPTEYVIAKRGSADRYVRVCQWHVAEGRLVPVFVRALVLQAVRDGAIGVRWAVYENEAESDQLVHEMKKLGFLCAPRVRIMMVHQAAPQFLTQAAWNLNDSLFSFDP